MRLSPTPILALLAASLFLPSQAHCQESAPTAQKSAKPQAKSRKAARTKLACAQAALYSEEHEGLAVLVYEDGERVFEAYQNGFNAKKSQHIYSGTKSFAPVVALVAEREGLLTLDELASDTITEWKGDPKRAAIKIRHLLDFTSGLRINDREMHSPKTRDKYASAIACRAASAPGAVFRYGSCHLMAFGELFRRKLEAASAKEKDFVDYLRARVLDPIGCKVAFWLRDGKKNPALPYGAFMTAREWAKFGQLILDKGRHKKRALLPEKALAQCFRGTKANPIYGLNFWLVGKRLHRADRRIPKDTVAAAGMYKQKLFIIPSRRLVIVRFGKTGVRSSFQDRGFLGALFAKRARQEGR